MAFRDSLHPLGVGVNLKVVAEFALPLAFSLSDLEKHFRQELANWDHKHLGLDMGPQSYSAQEFAEKLCHHLVQYKVRSIKLARADGWSLVVAPLPQSARGCSQP
jgi:hypothetical protein